MSPLWEYVHCSDRISISLHLQQEHNYNSFTIMISRQFILVISPARIENSKDISHVWSRWFPTLWIPNCYALNPIWREIISLNSSGWKTIEISASLSTSRVLLNFNAPSDNLPGTEVPYMYVAGNATSRHHTTPVTNTVDRFSVVEYSLHYSCLYVYHLGA